MEPTIVTAFCIPFAPVGIFFGDTVLHDTIIYKIEIPYSIEYIMTRGLRNNNPGNIRLAAQTWQGEVRPSKDKSFCTFERVEYGYRALLKLLRNYRMKHNCKTVRDFIERWAPPVENHTEIYIREVCKRCGWTENYIPDVCNSEEMINFAEAISKMENGKDGDKDAIRRGWELL